MRIGNLSRAGRPAGGHSGRLLRVLSLAGVGALLLAVWQILPFALTSEPSGRTSTAALSSSETAGRALGHGETPARRPASATATRAAPESPAPAAPAPRVVYSGPSVTSSASAGAGPNQPAAPAPAPAASVRSLAPLPVAAPARSLAPPPAPAPAASPAAARAAPPAPEPAPASQRTASVAPPAQGSAPAGRIDLNSASVEELNAIPGAGLIGRAIQRGRPYASPEDLVAKRILNRAAYERIKDQITAQ
jgi:helix-hairpin-helix protein